MMFTAAMVDMVADTRTRNIKIRKKRKIRRIRRKRSIRSLTLDPAQAQAPILIKRKGRRVL